MHRALGVGVSSEQVSVSRYPVSGSSFEGRKRGSWAWKVGQGLAHSWKSNKGREA